MIVDYCWIFYCKNEKSLPIRNFKKAVLLANNTVVEDLRLTKTNKTKSLLMHLYTYIYTYIMLFSCYLFIYVS